jgi:hypothetical protein
MVIGHWSFGHSLSAQLGAALGPRLHAGLLGLGLAFALGGAGELLRALLAADALVVNLGPALGTMPVLDLQDKLRSGTDANHDSAAFLLNEPIFAVFEGKAPYSSDLGQIRNVTKGVTRPGDHTPQRAARGSDEIDNFADNFSRKACSQMVWERLTSYLKDVFCPV